MDAWDLLIVGAAAYVAIVSLVRLMAGRRNELLGEVRSQVARELSDSPDASDRGAA